MPALRVFILPRTILCTIVAVEAAPVAKCPGSGDFHSLVVADSDLDSDNDIHDDEMENLHVRADRQESIAVMIRENTDGCSRQRRCPIESRCDTVGTCGVLLQVQGFTNRRVFCQTVPISVSRATSEKTWTLSARGKQPLSCEMPAARPQAA